MATINTGAGQAIFLGTFAEMDTDTTTADSGSGDIDDFNPLLISGDGTGSNLLGYTLTGAALDTAIVDTNGQLDDVNNNGSYEIENDSGDLVFGSVGDVAMVIFLNITDGAGNVTNTSVVAFQNGAGEIYVFDFVDRLTGNIKSIEITGISNTGGSAPASGFQSGGSYYADDLNAVCFAAGTFIQTKHGQKRVEALKVGDLVLTLDHGFQPIRWVGRRRFNSTELQRNPKLLPVRISAGALGQGLPSDDLSVSRQHRMLVSSNIVRRMFDEKTVLIPAIKLRDLPGVFVDEHVTEVEYFHLFFDVHEVVFANGAPAESFFPGPQAISALDHDARTELFGLFPELSHAETELAPAYAIPGQLRQRSLVARHIKNNQPILQNFVSNECFA